MHSPDFEIAKASSALTVWDFVSDGEPPLGAHLVTPRRGYCHHGIYIGQGKVVHYAGLSSSFHRGPVEELGLNDFAANRRLFVQSVPNQRYCREEVVRRACSRLGERRYRLFTNNCEHFCNWCLYGENHSEQVSLFWKDFLALPMRIAISLKHKMFELAHGYYYGKSQHVAMRFGNSFPDP